MCEHGSFNNKIVIIRYYFDDMFSMERLCKQSKDQIFSISVISEKLISKSSYMFTLITESKEY